jgi:HlyD family secretion protein
VDEADIGQVQEGQTVKFTVDAFPDDSYTGVVTQVRKQPETSQNVVAYIVIAEAENPSGKLLPGMTANADIVIEQRRNVMKVPVAALRWKPADQQAPAQSGSGGSGSGTSSGSGGGGARGGGGQRMIEQLGLSADQQKKAEPILADMRAKTMAAMSTDDPQARRAAMGKAREEMLAKLEPILTADQKTKLVALRAQMQQGGGRRGGAGSGVVWVLRDNKPTPIPVRIGASDGSYTEVVTNALKVGDELIIGGGPKAKVQVRSPLAPGGGGSGGARRGGPPGGL